MLSMIIRIDGQRINKVKDKIRWIVYVKMQ
jgi:hypothetical protein